MEESIEKIITEETKQRLKEMESSEYRFPQPIGVIDVVLSVLLIGICGVLITLCLLGVIL